MYSNQAKCFGSGLKNYFRPTLRKTRQGISALWINAVLQLLSVTGGGGGNFWVFWPRSSPLLLT